MGGVLRLFLEFMHRGGGLLMWCIFAVSVVIWTIGIGRWLFFRRVEYARHRFLRLLAPLLEGKAVPEFGSTGIDEFDSLLRSFATVPERNAGRATALLRQFLICIVPRLNRGFATMAAWISVAPLLGLLGTVVGMIETFRVITLFGVGNPALTAEGISVALLTTQAGLTVAFPGVVLQNFLNGRRAHIMAQLMRDSEEIVRRITQQGEKRDA